MNKQNTELKKAGLKATLPRIKIMEILASTAIQEEAHFSAEDIYKELLNNGENIGLASVYRVLTQFESAGMVKKHHFEGSHAVYEVIEEHHEHMVDVETGKVLEFQEKHPDQEAYVNSGYFVFEPEVFKYFDGDDVSLEALGDIAKDKKLFCYFHEGYWQCMDTKRDLDYLNKLWYSNQRLWTE